MLSRWGEGRTVLFFILFCHTVSLLFFCKGFLLKRVVIPEFTNCTYEKHFPELRLHEASSATFLPTCHSSPRKFRRAVWLLIDALRYDFMVFNDTPPHPLPAYQNKMPFVRDLLRSSPANARLFKFLADPPTTTMQRLKALTTGSLPTFIDVGSNFNSYAISEDNLLQQAKMNGRNVTFIGDDTWLSLYPDGVLTKVHDYPSLNVQDFDTVDDGVMKHLEPELATMDADLIIGHMLGVDHIGHTYGPSHWTMGEKLAQIDDFLELVIAHLDADTLLLVFGDHGMTPTGDHGGETHLETDAAMLVYSAQPLFDPSEPALGREVQQVDIVPTTALVLGLPIPFSNLGMLIPDLFLPIDTSLHTKKKKKQLDKEGKIRDEEQVARRKGIDSYGGRVTFEYLSLLQTNTEQLHTYLATYAEYSGDFPASEFRALEHQYQHLVELHQRLRDLEEEQDELSAVDLQQKLSEISTLYVLYMKEVKTMCSKVWAKFDNFPMIQAQVLLTVTVGASFLMLTDMKRFAASLVQSLSPGFRVGLALSGIWLLLTGLDWSILGILTVLLNCLLICFLSIFIVFAWVFRHIYLKLVLTLLKTVKHHSWGFPVKGFAIVVIVSHAVSMFSNSFILYEADMSAFFIQSLTVFLAVKTLKAASLSQRLVLLTITQLLAPHLILMVCVRFSKLFYACRDLQFIDGCASTTFLQGLVSASDSMGNLAMWRLVASSLAVAAVPAVLMMWLRCNKSLSFPLKLCVLVGLPLCVGCVVIHWYVQSLPPSTKTILPHWRHVTAPLTVYVLTAVTVLVTLLCPLKKNFALSIEEPPVEEKVGESPETVLLRSTPNRKDHERAPRLRRHLAEEEEGTLEEREELVQRVLPNDGTLSGDDVKMMTAVTVTVVVSLWVPLAMLLNDGVALSAFLTIVEGICVLFILRSYGGQSQGVSMEISALWVMLSVHSFFSLGHQPTVTNLRFEAGFVGIHGEITSYNLPFAALLVGLNTMASQILFGFGVPLLVLVTCREKHQPVLNISEKLLYAAVSYSSIHSLKLLMSMLAACLHRRHLMVWQVFAPRFLYEGAFQIVTDVIVTLGFMFVQRVQQLTRNAAVDISS